MTRRARLTWFVGVPLVAVAGTAAFLLRGSASSVLAADEPSVPTTRVARGSLETAVHTTGELRASKSMVMQAPSVAGGTLRLVTMVATGSPVKTGDVIMEFDPTEQQYQMEQSLSELAEAEQQIAKLMADREVQAAQDAVDLLTARFDVRRGELDALPDKDLMAANEYERRRLSLDEARRKLTQLEESGKSRAETNRASLAVATEKRTKAGLAADRARLNIESLIVKSPMDGFVIARENRDASGGFFYSGMTLPEYKAGDNVYPGRPVADVFDISSMEVRGKVNEQQRVNVAAGQSATLQSDALPGVPLTAKVTAVSGAAQTDFWGGSGPLRTFDVMLRIDQADTRLRPGTSVRIELSGSKVEGVLHVPRQAIFEKNGKPVVFVRVGDRFEPKVVQPTHRTEGRVALAAADGLAEGLEIAMVNPEKAPANAKKSSGTPAAGVAK